MYEGRFEVADGQVRFYEENGFVQLHDVLNPAEVATLRQALDVAVEDRKRLQENWGPRADEGYTKVFLQMVNVWERYPAMEEYVLSERIGGIARQLTRSSHVRLWHDHALIKYPQDSKATAWHQDKVYWPMKENGALSCWMALDDVTINNGCMWFIPGSHKLGPLNPVDLGNAGDEDLLQLLPMGGRESVRPFVAEMKAGSCTFHNGLTFHYAGPNTTHLPRRAMVTIFMPAGTHYAPLEHIIGDRGQLKEGEEFHGPLFPVVSKKEP
ncbi:MAG: phytanoyl-CoA dioxygenase [Bacteroidetes bacterium]|nr:phytanoyl-CoA dioxygenase [Bacteroidota bacterium]